MSLAKNMLASFGIQTYQIKVIGCDDFTEFEMTLTNSEFQTIVKFVKACNEASDSYCQPTIELFLKTEKTASDNNS